MQEYSSRGASVIRGTQKKRPRGHVTRVCGAKSERRDLLSQATSNGRDGLDVYRSRSIGLVNTLHLAMNMLVDVRVVVAMLVLVVRMSLVELNGRNHDANSTKRGSDMVSTEFRYVTTKTIVAVRA